MKKKTILCLFDYHATTGFATVSQNIIPRVKKHFGDEIDLHVCAINYFGEQYIDESGIQVISAVKSAKKHDDFGRFGFLKTLQDHDYDGIFIIQDLGVIVPIIAHLKWIKEQKANAGKKLFKSIFYFPVDFDLIPELVKDIEFFDTLITYTEYGRNCVLNHRPDLKGKLKVIPHGTDLKNFYPINIADTLKFKAEYFGNENVNKFIVSNISRNQHRKDIPSTILAFRLFKKEYDAAFKGGTILYLHMNPKDPMGWDLRTILKQTDLVEGVDVMFPPKEIENAGATLEVLNKIYNASDICLTTTLGEGWGLCQLPSTMITTTTGVREIKDVKIGDMVLGNDGLYHPVIDTTFRTVDSYIKLKTKYGYFLEATHEHPYYVLSNGNESWRMVNDIKMDDYIGIVKPVGSRELPKHIDLADFIPKNSSGWVYDSKHVWNKMGFSPKNDKFSYTALIKKYNTTKKVAENAKAYLSGKKTKVSYAVLRLAKDMQNDGYIHEAEIGIKKINRFITIDDDFLEMIGVFLADGNSSGGIKVEFNLNVTTKKELAQKIVKTIDILFGKGHVSSRVREKRFDVSINSKLISSMFSQLCGSGAYNKKVPEIFIGSEKYLMPLVKGYLMADGHISYERNVINFSTVSPSLAFQFQSILASNNILISLVKRMVNSEFKTNYDAYQGTILRHHLRLFLDKSGIKGELGRESKRNHRPDFIETSTHFFVPVKSIEVIENKGQEVFDLCVEGSHSFVGNGLVCHNTFTESAATRLPIVAPYSTSFIEMSEYGKNAYMIEDLQDYVGITDNIIRKQVNLEATAEELLNATIDIKNQTGIAVSKVDSALKWAGRLNWNDLVKDRWIGYFRETFKI